MKAMRTLAIAVLLASCATSKPAPRPTLLTDQEICDNPPPGVFCNSPSKQVERDAAPSQTADAAAAEAAAFDEREKEREADAKAAWAAYYARKAEAKRIAAKQAAEAAKFNLTYPGAMCVRTMGAYENDIRGSLDSVGRLVKLNAQDCTTQHKLLKYLSQFPAIERGEQFDKLMDAAAAAHR